MMMPVLKERVRLVEEIPMNNHSTGQFILFLLLLLLLSMLMSFHNQYQSSLKVYYEGIARNAQANMDRMIDNCSDGLIVIQVDKSDTTPEHKPNSGHSRDSSIQKPLIDSKKQADLEIGGHQEGNLKNEKSNQFSPSDASKNQEPIKVIKTNGVCK